MVVRPGRDGRRGRGRLYLAACGLAVVAGAVLFLAGWFTRTPWASDHRPPARTPEDIATLAEQWLAAVAGGDKQAALDLAGRITGPLTDVTTRDPAYVRLAGDYGIDESFFTGPFDEYDFQLWRHAHFFHELAASIMGGNIYNVRALFDAVTERVESRTEVDPEVPWPYRIWQRRFGLCDRQAWVLCQLAYQQGWRVQVVYLMDPETGQSPHTVCELRRGPIVHFADPYTRHFLPNVSVERLASDEALLKQVWPDRPDYRAAIAAPFFWTPAYAQNYRERNARLQAALQEALGERCPRFGADPVSRVAAYYALRRGTESNVRPDSMGLWPYPFVLLRHQMALAQAGRPEAASSPAGA